MNIELFQLKLKGKFIYSYLTLIFFVYVEIRLSISKDELLSSISKNWQNHSNNLLLWLKQEAFLCIEKEILL